MSVSSIGLRYMRLGILSYFLFGVALELGIVTGVWKILHFHCQASELAT